MSINLDQLEAVMARMHALGVAELSYEADGVRIRLKAALAFMARDSPAPASAPAPIPAARSVPRAGASAPGRGMEIITSPMHGSFYVAPSPDAQPFAAPGARVAAGEPICVLEAMKTLSRIEAEFDCIIRETLCPNGQAVEPGTPLFLVERIDV